MTVQSTGDLAVFEESSSGNSSNFVCVRFETHILDSCFESTLCCVTSAESHTHFFNSFEYINTPVEILPASYGKAREAKRSAPVLQHFKDAFGDGFFGGLFLCLVVSGDNFPSLYWFVFFLYQLCRCKSPALL